jgi:hypothetical protein
MADNDRLHMHRVHTWEIIHTELLEKKGEKETHRI